MPKIKRRTRYESHPPDGYLNTRAACKFLGVSRRTLDRAVEEKKLAAYTFALRVSRTTPHAFKMEDLKALRAIIQKARRVP